MKKIGFESCIYFLDFYQKWCILSVFALWVLFIYYFLSMEEMEMMANGFDFTGTVSMSMSGDASFGWGVIMIVLLVVALFMAVVRWRLFSKANLPGWGSLVPIYNAYLFFKLAGRPGWIWWFLFPPVAAILCVVAQFRIARNFGKGEWFAIGMWFLPVIFYPILAFWSAEFHDREADTQSMSVQ